MSPQLASLNAISSVKSEESYKSPASSLSDLSQHENGGTRGRRQDRERSATARADEESFDEKEIGTGLVASGKPRKRKRSRKGLDKNFACPQQGCGKSYSRAEHLYRHQLNRESSKPHLILLFLCYFDFIEKIPRKTYTFATLLDVNENLLDKIYASVIGSVILPEVPISKGKTLAYRVPIVEPPFLPPLLVIKNRRMQYTCRPTGSQMGDFPGPVPHQPIHPSQCRECL